MGIPWGWELVTKLGIGMGRNGNRLHGNGREWACKKPFPGISTRVYLPKLIQEFLKEGFYQMNIFDKNHGVSLR